MEKKGALEPVYATRASGEARRIEFDPRTHPGIIKRLLVAGFRDEAVAAVVGVAPETLKAWFSRYPALGECRVEARMREADLIDTAFRMALGEVDEATGQFTGGSPSMMQFILERRYGWVKPAPAARSGKGKGAQQAARELPDEGLPEALDRAIAAMGGETKLLALIEALAQPPRGSPH